MARRVSEGSARRVAGMNAGQSVVSTGCAVDKPHGTPHELSKQRLEGAPSKAPFSLVTFWREADFRGTWASKRKWLGLQEVGSPLQASQVASTRQLTTRSRDDRLRLLKNAFCFRRDDG